MEARASCLCRSAQGTGAACTPRTLGREPSCWSWRVEQLPLRLLASSVLPEQCGIRPLRALGCTAPAVVHSCAHRQRGAAIVRGACHASSARPDSPASSCLGFLAAVTETWSRRDFPRSHVRTLSFPLSSLRVSLVPGGQSAPSTQSRVF